MQLLQRPSPSSRACVAVLLWLLLLLLLLDWPLGAGASRRRVACFFGTATSSAPVAGVQQGDPLGLDIFGGKLTALWRKR